MSIRLCWTCKQPATHALTRDGSIPLDACDNCTRIDRAEAESRGWTIAPITQEEPIPAMKIRLTETQRNCLRFGYTVGHGVVAVERADTLTKLVDLGLIVADADGKGGRLTAQGTSIAIGLVGNPNKAVFEVESAGKREPERVKETPKSSPLGSLASTPPHRFTGAGSYGYTGRSLPDDSDITHATVADLVVSFCEVMDSVTRTNNTTSLAELGRYAGRLWWEMTGRGVEFR